MGFNRRIIVLLVIISTTFFNSFAQNLVINELMSSNSTTIYDEDGDSPDWIEILNNGNSAVNLSDYYLSDDTTDLLKWNLPDLELAPNEPFLVFASGKDRNQLSEYWYTIINIGHEWKYILPTSEPSPEWRKPGFDDSTWKTGASGIGYGDGDDNTVIAKNTISVYMRTEFDLKDVDSIESILMHMDYDDGFVAFINGTELCRGGIGVRNDRTLYNSRADGNHEAKIYAGGKPESFEVSQFRHSLKESNNVLAVQIHNVNDDSSDLTGIPIFSLAYNIQVDIEAAVSEYVEAPGGVPHANFKLSSSGETLSLSYKDNTVVDSLTFGIIPGNNSFGRNIDSLNEWGYFNEPTPGELNQTDFLTEIVTGEINFSITEMFLTKPTFIVLSGAGEGEVIRYTIDGSEPTNFSWIAQRPVELRGNTVIRARIFKTGAIPGKTVSRTYLFDEKPTLPIISLYTNPENLWDNETGIYVLGDDYENRNPYYGANFWEDWEKPAGIEMIQPDGQRIFSLNCGIKIFGAWSRARDQKSLAVFFRKEYGDSKLENIQLFKSKSITEFKSIVLRNAGNDYDQARFRDGMMTDLVKDMDTDIQAFEPAVLYLNGEYWGHINIREKLNEEYLASNHDVKASEIDLLEGNAHVNEGSNADYLDLLDLLNSNDIKDETYYQIVAEKVDISNFIDYQLSQIYFDNRDWPGNNIKFWRPQTEDGKWRWLMYDTDFGFGLYGSNAYTLNTLDFATSPNGPGWPNPPWSTFLLRKLLENNQFKNAFVNRFADMLNTTFKGDVVVNRIDSIAALMEPAIPAQTKKWTRPSLSGFKSSVQTMRTFALKRVSFMETHIQQEFSLPNKYNVSVSVYPSNSGIAKLNSISLTESRWNGNYYEDVPITLKAIARPGFKFSNWEVDGVSILEETINIDLKNATVIRAVFEESSDGNSIVINEINYSSPDEYDAGDWIELYNWGGSDIDISGWILKDNSDVHSFVVPENTILNSDGYLVLCRSAENFATVHSGVSNYIGEFEFGLASTGDAVRLFKNEEQLIDEVTFGVDDLWPTEPNGTGPTLELHKFSDDNSNAQSWKSSDVNLGTPGAKNSITTGIDGFSEEKELKQLKVYPNPFTVETRIQIDNYGYEPVNIQIFTLDGRQVVAERIMTSEYIWRGENNGGQKVQPGIYIVKVQLGANTFTEKIILSR